jgi:transcriptional regulator with XRE-family HTH domain
VTASDQNIQKLFGTQLRRLRRARGISQEELAHSCQLDRSYVGQVERGERNISLINIAKLAKGLNVHPYETLMFSTDSSQEGSV